MDPGIFENVWKMKYCVEKIQDINLNFANDCSENIQKEIGLDILLSDQTFEHTIGKLVLIFEYINNKLENEIHYLTIIVEEINYLPNLSDLK